GSTAVTRVVERAGVAVAARGPRVRRRIRTQARSRRARPGDVALIARRARDGVRSFAGPVRGGARVGLRAQVTVVTRRPVGRYERVRAPRVGIEVRVLLVAVLPVARADRAATVAAIRVDRRVHAAGRGAAVHGAVEAVVAPEGEHAPGLGHAEVVGARITVVADDRIHGAVSALAALVGGAEVVGDLHTIGV